MQRFLLTLGIGFAFVGRQESRPLTGTSTDSICSCASPGIPSKPTRLPIVGLTVEKVDPTDALWGKLYELYVRSDNFVSTAAAKCIESAEGSFVVAASD
ncbi:MAG: hypothetical protein U1E22_06950 [Coriobacteriia bacterium]|nr:hypothetical protein [Coriobacteriia bacterium]